MNSLLTHIVFRIDILHDIEVFIYHLSYCMK